MYNIVKKDQYTKNELENIKNREHIMSMNVDSLFRDNYTTTTSSDYIFKLPTTIRDVMSMRLVAIELPNTWYTFNEGVNNIFIVIEDDGPGIPEDIIAKIGEPYIKSKSIEVSSNSGLGLGTFFHFISDFCNYVAFTPNYEYVVIGFIGGV